MPIEEPDLTRICNNCVENEILSEEIKKQGKHGICDHCGEPGQITELEDLADRINDVIQEHFQLTPGYPEEPVELFLYKEGEWEQRGDPADILIGIIAGVDEPIAEKLTSILSGKHTYEAAKDGVENPYGLEAMYEEREVFDLGFQIAWGEFQREIQSKSRFFSVTAEHVLARIFESLDALGTHDNRPIIATLRPCDQERYIWRGRTARATQEVEKILREPVKELGPPPSHLARAGRMNADGISVFYGAMEKCTCISELRPPVGSSVVIGKFSVTRTVKLLDLGALADTYVSTSHFDPKFLEHKSRAIFLKRLVGEISKPVVPEEERVEYLATQAVAEFLANKASPKVDGIIFPSSQTGGKGRNVVLFNHARGVVAHDLPVNSTVEVSMPIRTYTDDEDITWDTILVEETVPSNPSGGDPPEADEEERLLNTPLFIEDLLEAPEEALEPSLQLDIDSLEVMETTGVSYSSNSRQIVRIRQTEDERNDRHRWWSQFITVDDSSEE